MYSFFYSTANSFNLRARLKGTFFTFLALTLPLILVVNFLASSASKDLLHQVLGKPGTETLYLYLVSMPKGEYECLPLIAVQYSNVVYTLDENSNGKKFPFFKNLNLHFGAAVREMQNLVMNCKFPNEKLY